MEATILKDPVVYEHTDKVKPKFHEGDWVTNGIDCIFQIASIENGIYYDINNCGSDIESTDKSYHLWTINDAKDGDILAVTMYPEGTWIGIFKEQNGCTFSSHCFVNTEGTFKLGTHNHGNGRAIHPATKEQRDLLFQKMEEAGYEWDAGKKELKEIEDEEYDGDDYGIDSLWHAKKILEETLGEVKGYQSDDGILEHKCAISAVDRLYKQKHAEWSEEDERKLAESIALIRSNNTGTFYYEKDELSSFLKSIRDRIQPQPKQEWSEEDEEHLNSIISDIKTDMGAYPRSQEVIDICNDDISWLKSIKDRIQPQPKQEWSEEDEEMLGSIIVEVSYIGEFPDYPTKEENELYDECLAKVEWLKSIKDRVQPQPECSEEDEDVINQAEGWLDTLCDYLKDSSSEYISEVKDVINKLKFLRPQSKQGWSEKDERERKHCVDFLNHPGMIKATPTIANDCKDWLKSLKQRYIWKPSDEQIEALAWALSLAKNCGEECAFDIRTLYEQLTKLREE